MDYVISYTIQVISSSKCFEKAVAIVMIVWAGLKVYILYRVTKIYYNVTYHGI